jgi:hypothetical protein
MLYTSNTQIVLSWYFNHYCAFKYDPYTHDSSVKTFKTISAYFAERFSRHVYGEREREGERGRGKEKEREREREWVREGERDSGREREGEWVREGEGERESEGEREWVREWEREWVSEREKKRVTERERERERERDPKKFLFNRRITFSYSLSLFFSQQVINGIADFYSPFCLSVSVSSLGGSCPKYVPSTATSTLITAIPLTCPSGAAVPEIHRQHHLLVDLIWQKR